jgi:hypothetical protein
VSNRKRSVYVQGVLPFQELAHADYVARARKAARELSTVRGCITIDDVWDVCPVPPGIDPRVLGAVFKGSHEQWEAAGYQRSRRKVNHGRPVAVWRLRNA